MHRLRIDPAPRTVLRPLAWTVCALLACTGAVPMSSAQAAESTPPHVDACGQVTDVTWPGKIADDRALRDQADADDDALAAVAAPRRDVYGGDPGSGTRLGLKRTGRFHVEKTRAGRSVLVDPAGNQFFSLGLNVFGGVGDTYTQTKGREQEYAWLPPTTGAPTSAAWRDGKRENFSFYVSNQVRTRGVWDQRDYWKRQVRRAKKWGFNTVGGFSDLRFRAAAPMPYVAHLDAVPEHPIGDSGLYDVYAPGLQKQLDTSMAQQSAQYRGDPQLIGYMFFNEIPWNKLRTAVTSAKASEVASKGAFVDLLRTRYATIGEFNAAWGMKAASFDALRELEFTPRNEAAVADVDAFSKQFVERFYRVFSSAIRKADPKALVLGDRWYGGVIANDKLRGMLATAAGRHLDVLTYNYYTWDLDPARIDDIYAKSGGTPLILSEFHYGEPTRGLTFGIRMAKNEDEKGRLYRNYVEKAAASGKIVGAHWFEYLDQAATGRWFQGTDGEAGGIGLVDVADHPYARLLEQVMRSHRRIYAVADAHRVPYHFPFSPTQTERKADNRTQIPRATSALTVDGALDAAWPAGPTITLGTTDLIDGVAEEGVQGRFRLAWDAKNLYVHGTIDDPTPMRNQFHGFDIWNGDALELFVGPRNVAAGGAIQVSDSQLIVNAHPQDGTGRLESFWYNERPDQPKVTAVAKPAPRGYTLEAAIPLVDLGIDAVKPPRDLRFDLGFDDGNGRQRQRQFMWNGVDGNAENRDAWGRATLVEKAADVGPGTGPQNPPAATVVTSRVPADGQLFVAGAGPAGARFDVRFDGASLGTITVPPSGRFEMPFEVPPGTRIGRHTVSVRQGSDTLATGRIRVTAPFS